MTGDAMVRARGSIQIGRSPARVFALLADPTQIPRWREDVVEATALDGSGVGARYAEVVRFMGRASQTFEVLECDPGRRWAVRAVEGLSLRPVQRFVLEPQEGGTRVSYEIELAVTGAFRLMAPLLAWMIPSRWRGYAERLRLVAEA